MSRMAFMVFAVDQSWNAEKHACRIITSVKRIARRRLYAAGEGVAERPPANGENGHSDLQDGTEAAENKI